MKPKINLIYYKKILDACMSRFFDDYGSEFSRNSDGEYVFSGSLSESTMRSVFRKYVEEETGKYVVDFRESSPEFLFVLGSCFPGENVLLETEMRAPKLRKLVKIIPDVTYFLKETDIRLDMRMMNSVFHHIFEKFMKERKKTWENVFFIKHRKIDSYVLYRFFKKRFGSMVVNIKKKHGLGEDNVIKSVNESMDRCCPFKDDYIERGVFEKIEDEVMQYVDSCINGES